MLAHGVPSTWGLCNVRNSGPLCNKGAKCNLRGGKTQAVATCHTQVRWEKEEEVKVERAHWQ